MRLLVSITVIALLASGCGPSGESGGISRVEKLREAVVAKVTMKAKPAAVAPAELKFYDDIAEATVVAKAAGKPLLLVFAAEWCFHSRQLVTITLPHESVRNLTERFVCVRIDVDRAPELVEEYRVRAYPTLIFAAPSGTVLQRLTGAQPDVLIAEQLAATLSTVTERLAMPLTAAPLQR
jgi:thioredoxin-like negative regulator of GroEL